jgi:predicted TPR repeat methyltransferase
MGKKKKKRSGAKAKRPPHRRIRASPQEAVGAAIQLHRTGRLKEAEDLYRKILGVMPDQVDALHFLGVLLHQTGKSDEAIDLIRKVIVLKPDYADAQNNLGNVLKESGRLAEAVDTYRTVIELDPAHADAHNNLGTVLNEQGKHDDAIEIYERAISLNPKHADAYGNLGNALKKVGRLHDALTAYRQAIELKPKDGPAHLSLGSALYGAGRVDEAASVYQHWLALEPDSSIATHMLAACTGEGVPERASDAFVARTFDAFAGSFDKVLHRLEYRAPELVVAELATDIPAADGSLDVLDAGCGTGLCGPLLKPYASRLVGVDLSPGMLRKASGREVYSELIESELTAFMEGNPAAFDVIASADTLVYFGALDAVFAAAATALSAGGWLVFSLEREADESLAEGFRLNPHGRYSHTETYVRRMLKEAGLSLHRVTYDVLRKEAAKPVSGLVVLAGKD